MTILSQELIALAILSIGTIIAIFYSRRKNK
jgi:hypothetical protein